ncbi:MAG: CBS domain-containing protein [Ilumatobacteraceae bacterium]
MAGELIYAFRVMRLPLLDADGVTIGRLEDIVVVPGTKGNAPRVVGFVASSQRRRIFVSVGRVSLDDDGARMRSWDVDVNPFKAKPGEILVSSVIDRKVGDETVSDVAIGRAVTVRNLPTWEIAKIRLARRSALRRRPSFRLVDWDENVVLPLFASSEMAAEAARLRDMHPSDVAVAVRALPLAQRRQLAQMLDDERLADLLEELPEADQLRIIEGLDIDRLLGVLEEMEYDDLVDLLSEMPGEQRSRILAAMDDDEEAVVRQLLSHAEGTAGSLMTPEVIILGPTSTVAEALAAIRNPDWMVSIAAQVFVCQPPYTAPTGQYLGVVYFQRLLREPPGMELGRCVINEPAVLPTIHEKEVAERLASYNLLMLPVCDEDGHLLGAITVDDVLDRVLPKGWRSRRGASRVDALPGRTEAS